jgi:hypothetical protein
MSDEKYSLFTKPKEAREAGPGALPAALTTEYDNYTIRQLLTSAIETVFLRRQVPTAQKKKLAGVASANSAEIGLSNRPLNAPTSFRTVLNANGGRARSRPVIFELGHTVQA